MIKKRVCSLVTAMAMTVSCVPFLASVVYTNTASTQAYAEGEYTIPELNFESKEIPNLESFKFVADMELGINLGNTFDAIDDDGYNADPLDIESSWVGIKTTKEMIDAMKNAGFKTVRIPVSWHNHVDENNQIDEAWLNRVQEVVDYAVANDMYIILNIHHDNESGFFPDNEHLDQSLKYVEDIWTQLAEKFKDYSNKLVFESLNEPRLVGGTYEWWFNSSAAECVEAQECINQLNQKFVDVVRASGGNNADRYLMVPAYCANADAAASDVFKMPEDTVENKLILEVHAYIPYHFAMEAPDEATSVKEFDPYGTDGGEIDSLMDKLYLNFVSKNIPVVIDEFGARNKDDNTQARTNYAAYYIAAARARGITCCWWDNYAFDSYSGEAFGLLDRASCTMKYPSVAEGMVKYANDDNTNYVTPGESDDRVGLVNKTASGATAIFSRTIGDKVEIDIELGDNTGYLMGCIDFSVQIGDTYYWVAYQYDVTSSGTVQFDINNPDMVNAGDTPVEDESIKAQLIESIKAMNSFNIQCWYASDKSGVEITPATDAGEFTGARIVAEKTEPTTTTTTSATTTTTTTTTTVTTTASDTTASTSQPDDDFVWGDANLDGSIDIADAVAVAAYVGSPESNELQPQGILNADVHSSGNGLNSSDVLTLQQYIAGIL